MLSLSDSSSAHSDWALLVEMAWVWVPSVRSPSAQHGKGISELLLMNDFMNMTFGPCPYRLMSTRPTALVQEDLI